MKINVLQPSMTEVEVQAVGEVLRSGWLGEGPKVAEFERRLAARYGYRNCVAVNSATAALHLALLSHGVGPGDEVIVPALTFVSTALAVVYCGARPVFADVDSGTLTIDERQIGELCSPRTKAIVPVDYAGYPAIRWSEAWHPPIVQDAAHSCGGTGYGDSVCLSFHPVKNLSTGDGGAILLNDDERAARLRALRWCGIDRSTWQRSGKRYSWDYAIGEVGYKAHWNDIQASIGLVQLDRLDAMNARRRAIAKRYHTAFAEYDTSEYGVIAQPMIQRPAWHDRHTWHLYVIRVDAERRDDLIDYLAERGISAGVHYKPLTYYPMFRQPTPPVTEREWRRLVSLPIHANLTDDEQTRVIEAVEEALR